jgi:hypothetical protein
MSQTAMRRPGRVLIFGSLYLAGQVLRLHDDHRLFLAKYLDLAQRQAWR